MDSVIERRSTIEEQTARFAVGRRERMLAHAPTKAVRIVREETKKEIFPLPPLAWNDPRPYTLKFNPFTGEVYVPFWRQANTIRNNDQRSLANAEEFVQIRRRKEHQVDFNDLPKRRVVELNYKRVGSLEGAIRQATHVMDAYRSGGKEAGQVDQTWAWINFQLGATLTGKLTEDSLAILAKQTAIFLDSSGLIRAREQTKKNISLRLTKASSLDRLGRVNPLITRIRIRSAYLETVKREMLSVLVSEKFEPFLAILLMEREYTLQVLKGTVEDLDTMAGFTKRGAAPFVDGKSSGKERQGMKKVLEEIARSLAEVRVLPYLPAARLAAINLVGCREDKKELNKRIIGEPAEKLFSLTSVEELISLGDFSEAKERIQRLSYQPLMDVLKKNEEIGLAVQ